MEEITLQQAVTKLCKELVNDKDLYDMWYSNIAMSFFDQMNVKERVNFKTFHYGYASIDGAKNFLNSLIKDTLKEYKEPDFKLLEQSDLGLSDETPF